MEIPLLDAIDIEILMHRDAHFGGNFNIMLEYYHMDGVGVMPDFEIDRIEELNKIQDELGENLSAKVLPMPALEQVKKSQDLYKKLRDVYQNKTNHIPILLSDLILTEDEEPTKVINELVANATESYGPLLNLVDSEHFYDPLFPGYGRTPMFAAKCLEKIGNPKAIPHLFNALGQENFALDESLIHALVSFGATTKDFLFKIVQKMPLSKDNEHAAIVLTSFPPDEEIGRVALSLLLEENMLKQENFSSYMICACEGLTKTSDRKALLDLSNNPSTPEHLANEMRIVTKTWL